ncbi:SSI family serine proteinase inhibitor [Streptomyces sp. CA-294286]|uniref:SSI family serine proteinase inhibitor n=1 Tax=Streptomyces sp. CA-294286 TaxID=3240070 RepID=UPI003D8E48D7
MSRRFAAAALPLLAVLGTAAPAQAGPEPHTGDRLTLTVAGTGFPGTEGTYELTCHPTGGSHPEAQLACDRLNEVTVYGKDPFAPVAADALCTHQYGGPATARLTGTWAGRPVDAAYSRTNGCEISRWDAMVPLLPHTQATPTKPKSPYRDAAQP